MSELIPMEIIESRILLIRGQKVLLDRDLATLYGVATSQLKRQVRRNLDRFPDDFMFELTKAEYESLRCQSGILKRGQHAKYLPFAFTEQGVAMLSSVLGSKEAIHVNICIMRAFVRMREMMLKHAEFSALVKELEERMDAQELNTIIIMDKLRALDSDLKKTKSNTNPKYKIGFKHSK